MDERGRAKEYLVERFEREGVIAGTPESLAGEAGFTAGAMEEALGELIGRSKVRPFQDDEGTLEYQWGDFMDSGGALPYLPE